MTLPISEPAPASGPAHERAPERPQAEQRHPRGRDPERDRDDQDEHHERDDGVAEREPQAAEDEPDQVQQQPHSSTLSLRLNGAPLNCALETLNETRSHSSCASTGRSGAPRATNSRRVSTRRTKRRRGETWPRLCPFSRGGREPAGELRFELRFLLGGLGLLSLLAALAPCPGRDARVVQVGGRLGSPAVHQHRERSADAPAAGAGVDPDHQARRFPVRPGHLDHEVPDLQDVGRTALAASGGRFGPCCARRTSPAPSASRSAARGDRAGGAAARRLGPLVPVVQSNRAP